jgi:hypothetical protein
MPMLSKVSQKDYGRGVTASDETIIFEYNNKDNGAQAGVIQQTRKSSFESNDALATTNPLPFSGAAKVGGWNTKTVNLFLGRTWEKFSFNIIFLCSKKNTVWNYLECINEFYVDDPR